MNDEVIDRAALKRLLNIVGNDPEELEDLLTDFNEDAPDLVRRMTDASGRGDVDALRIAAHSLKSNARDFGALRLSELCAELEQRCAEGAVADPIGAAIEIGEADVEARQALSLIDLTALGKAAETE